MHENDNNFHSSHINISKISNIVFPEENMHGACPKLLGHFDWLNGCFTGLVNRGNPHVSMDILYSF